MGLMMVALCVASGVLAAPVTDVVPPPVKRARTTHMASSASAMASTKSLHHAAAVAATRTAQALMQQDQEGGEAVDAPPIETGPPEGGASGSGVEYKDDQFYLNVAYDEAEFDDTVSVTWVRPAAMEAKLDYVGLYLRTDPDDAVPCNWEFAESKGDAANSGTVQLAMTNYGDMELRYYDVGADRPRVKLPITVFPPCPNNCTNHGECEKGMCKCFPPYKGEECCEVGGSITFDLNVTKVLIGEAVHAVLTPPVGELSRLLVPPIIPLASAPPSKPNGPGTRVGLPSTPHATSLRCLATRLPTTKT